LNKVILSVVIASIVLAVGIALYIIVSPGTGGASTQTSPYPTTGHGVWSKPLKRVIILRVLDNMSISYMEQDIYDRGSYEVITGNWSSYVEELKHMIREKYGSSGAGITDIRITRSDENYSVIIIFYVTNRVWSDDRVTADFLWFLNAWNLDFIDSHFNETDHGLSWNGVLDGVATSIEVIVPRQPGPYKAWGEPYGHCHGHVWWPRR
jgi:hypothetical protein